MNSLNAKEKTIINSLIDYYNSEEELFLGFQGQLQAIFFSSKELRKHTHSIKWRLKDSEHLKIKLTKKILDSKKAKETFDITKENLFIKINDLIGFRILHLHTGQFKDIDSILRKIFDDKKLKLVEKPCARTWDDEYRQFFKSLKIKTIKSETLYTSVHYVIQSNDKAKLTAEIQVRTLAEELWGEVDHIFNYPDKHNKKPCQEQIKVLARVTSSCTRLVDSIFTSYRIPKRKSL